MLERLWKPSADARALSYQTIFASGGDMLPRTFTGVSVTSDSAFRIGAVYACVRLLSDSISCLPADTFYRNAGERLPFRPKPAWVDNPDIGTSREDHFQQVMVSLLIDGNSYTRIFRKPDGSIAALAVLNPSHMKVRRNYETADIEYLHDDRTVISYKDMLHITELRRPGALKGISRIDEARQTLGLASALEEFSARFFGQGSVTSGIIETPASLTAEQAMELKTAFEATHKGLSKSNRVGVLGGGGVFKKTGVDPNEAQMLESRQFAVEEIARLFRVPLHLLQVSTPGAMSYASVEQNGIQFAQYTLRPYITKIETAYSTLLPGGAFIRFNMDALMRGDLTSRFAAYSTGQQSGFLSVNDIHRLEDMRPAEGGDEYRVPLANVNLSAANIVETDKKTMMAQRLINSGFDPAETLTMLGLPPIAHTGVPPVMLQGVAQIDPADPGGVYS